MIYGVAILAGIGFTMSLFVGNLAFPVGNYHLMVKVGVFAASVLSGVVGYWVLRHVTTSSTAPQHIVARKIKKPNLP